MAKQIQVWVLNGANPVSFMVFFSNVYTVDIGVVWSLGT